MGCHRFNGARLMRHLLVQEETNHKKTDQLCREGKPTSRNVNGDVGIRWFRFSSKGLLFNSFVSGVHKINTRLPTLNWTLKYVYK